MDQRYRVGQYGQEDVLEKLIYPNGNETHTGVFVEIGAYDGVDISNTYWLEKVKGWGGLLVEPIAQYAEEARHNRWCNVWTGCVYDRDGEADFLHIQGMSEMLSGIEEAMHERHKERIQQEISHYNQKRSSFKIPCKTINTLLTDAKLKHVDLLSLDCQTVELQVLQGYRFQENPIKAILLDMNGVNREAIKDLLDENGYELHWKHPSCDEHLFIHPQVKWSWQLLDESLQSL